MGYWQRIQRGARGLIDATREGWQRSAQLRRIDHRALLDDYFSLARDLYELSSGRAFHFAPLRPGQSFTEALLRHEHFIAERLALRPGMVALELGCGAALPMREIASFSGAAVIGVERDRDQLHRARDRIHRAGLAQRCRLLQATHRHLPLERDSCDAVYAIETPWGGAERSMMLAELGRVMKPGAGLASYEWCLTERFDARRHDHRWLRHNIEAGFSLPRLERRQEIASALVEAGFEIIEERDLAQGAAQRAPWYQPLKGAVFSLSGLICSPPGRALASVVTRVVERKGEPATDRWLGAGADALVAAGEKGIFTPMYFVHARKPN
jgi:sterol 24-C-methyltransferase